MRVYHRFREVRALKHRFKQGVIVVLFMLAIVAYAQSTGQDIPQSIHTLLAHMVNSISIVLTGHPFHLPVQIR